MTNRDDFTSEIKRVLASRVGLLCSNPECRAATGGPQSDPTKVVNIGVAAHVTAAAQGGPRFDASLSAEQRSSATNGIWLCQNCAKRIDSDVTRFSTELLRAWKVVAESLADAALGKPSTGLAPISSPSTPKEHAVAAIAANSSNAGSALRAFMVSLSQALEPVASALHSETPPTFDAFCAGIDAAKPLADELGQVASAVAEFSPAMASPLLRGFEGVLKQYEPDGVGATWTTSFDIAKFVGHELFLVMVASMARFERWNELADSMGQTLFRGRQPMTYSNILEDVVMAKNLEPEKKWISPHGELLRRRYESDAPVSFAELVDADYLVYLVTGISTRPCEFWFPTTVAYLNKTPDWLSRCQSASHLQTMLKLFGSPDIKQFKAKFAEVRLPRFDLAYRLNFSLIKPEAIGTYP